MDLFDRYMRGEREQVWAELIVYEGDVRKEPLFSATRRVASETMNRVRQNVDALVSRLRTLGYEFQSPEYIQEPLVSPSLDAISRLDEFERLVGALPISLRTFYEVVGAVCLAGSHPTWPKAYVSLPVQAYRDPLWVDPLDSAFAAYREWTEVRELDGSDEAGPLHIWIAPDELHKENISGGAPYEIAVPCAEADAKVLNEWHGVRFVEYLRKCFQWGGFPGFERFPESMRPVRDLQFLTRGLLPI